MIDVLVWTLALIIGFVVNTVALHYEWKRLEAEDPPISDISGFVPGGWWILTNVILITVTALLLGGLSNLEVVILFTLLVAVSLLGIPTLHNLERLSKVTGVQIQEALNPKKQFGRLVSRHRVRIAAREIQQLEATKARLEQRVALRTGLLTEVELAELQLLLKPSETPEGQGEEITPS